MQPIVHHLARQGYAVRQVDASRQPEVVARFGVNRFPTFIVVIDDQEFSRRVGMSTAAELARMMNEAHLAQASASPAQIESTGGPRTFAQPPDTASPQPGRVVPLQSDGPLPPREPAPPTANHPTAPLLAASVKIEIEDPDGVSTGTGTVIDAREGRALVLTCGHLFRASAGKGQVNVTLYWAGSQGAVPRETVPGRVIDFDLQNDLGLLEIATDSPLQAVSVAPTGTLVAPGDVVCSVGCNQGADPTVLQTRVTHLNRYAGTPNLEAAGAPVEGRSGGGLFSTAGQLVGVCFAADPSDDEGLYAALSAIHAKLDQLGLTFVYQASPADDGNTAVAEIAHPSDGMSIRGQGASVTQVATGASEPASPPSLLASAPRVTKASVEPAFEPTATPGRAEPSRLSDEERATLAEIRRHGEETEVICIIRPLTADGRSEVIKIRNASPEFVQALGNLQR
jgi:S1-C subfamily serine protease